MTLKFAKYEGIGNDFVVVDAPPTHPVLGREEAILLCDRHRGIGADGVLLVGLADGHPSMTVFNADGSRPEMCGNGIRCVALHLARTGRARVGEPFEIATDAGSHRSLVVEEGVAGRIQVSMRVPSLVPKPRDL